MSISGYPVLCGGLGSSLLSDTSQNCYKMTGKGWQEIGKTPTKRQSASYTSTSQGILSIGGSYVRKEVELLNKDMEWETRNNFPPGVSSHCVVNVNDSSLILIGGYQVNRDILDFSIQDIYFQYDSSGNRAETWFYDISKDSWSKGPSLPFPLSFSPTDCCCGAMRRPNGQRPKVMVVGGWPENKTNPYHHTFELDLQDPDPKWESGAVTPVRISAPQIVEDGSGGLFLAGGFDGRNSLTSIYHYSESNKKRGTWKKIKQELTIRKGINALFKLDRKFIECS